MTGAAKVSTCAGLLVEHIDPEAAVVADVAELLARDQVDRQVVLEDRDVRLLGHRGQQGALDLAAGDVLGVEDAALGMAALSAEVQLARAVGAGNLALGKVHAQLDQLRNPRRAFLDDRADGRFLAQARAGLQRVAHVQLEGVLLAGHRRDAALGVVGVGLGAVLLGDDRHAPVRRDFRAQRTAPRCRCPGQGSRRISSRFNSAQRRRFVQCRLAVFEVAHSRSLGELAALPLAPGYDSTEADSASRGGCLRRISVTIPSKQFTHAALSGPLPGSASIGACAYCKTSHS